MIANVPRIIAVDVELIDELANSRRDWASHQVPPGEWDNELKAARIIVGDTPAVALKNWGHAWCGYIGFPPGHSMFGESYIDHYEDWPDVHGGWTYSDRAEHLDAIAGMSGLWWIGFDCAHSGDLLPGMLGYSKRRSWESFKTIEYVAGQIAAAVTHEAFR